MKCFSPLNCRPMTRGRTPSMQQPSHIRRMLSMVMFKLNLVRFRRWTLSVKDADLTAIPLWPEILLLMSLLLILNQRSPTIANFATEVEEKLALLSHLPSPRIHLITFDSSLMRNAYWSCARSGWPTPMTHIPDPSYQQLSSPSLPVHWQPTYEGSCTRYVFPLRKVSGPSVWTWISSAIYFKLNFFLFILKK